MGDGGFVFGPGGLVGGGDFVVLGVDAEDLKALGGVLLFEVDEPGSFQLAGAAPGGPEVDEEGLAFVVGEGDLFAGEVLKGEGGRLLAEERGLGVGLLRIGGGRRARP